MTPTEAPAVEHVEVAGRRIALERSAGPGHEVLLVHGNFASKRWFAPLLAAPPEGLRLTAFDLPNFGDSDPLGGEISIAAYGEAVLGVRDALGLGRPVLLGHSLGGTVAMAAVAADPDGFSGLVLVSSSAPDGLVTPEGVYPFLERYRTEREPLRQALAAMVAVDRSPDFEAIVDDGQRMHESAFSGNARALAALARPDADLAPRLAAFTGPVWVVHGALHPLITADMAEATARAFTGAREVRLETWDDAGHTPYRDDLTRFTRGLSALTRTAAEGGAMR
jgi:pimeloyl-ACP methyl ester carboxylesterase